jgi:hypothetical protein
MVGPATEQGVEKLHSANELLAIPRDSYDLRA